MNLNWFTGNKMRKAIIPLNIFTSKIINSDQKLILSDIFQNYLHQKRYYKTNKTISHWLGISYSDVFSSMDRLEQMGLIHTKKFQNRRGGRSREVYAINVHTIFSHYVYYGGKRFDFIGPKLFPSWLKKVEANEQAKINNQRPNYTQSSTQSNNYNYRNQNTTTPNQNYQKSPSSLTNTQTHKIKSLFNYNSTDVLSSSSSANHQKQSTNSASASSSSVAPKAKSMTSAKTTSQDTQNDNHQTSSDPLGSANNKQVKDYYQSNQNQPKHSYPKVNDTYNIQQNIDNPYVAKITQKLHRYFPSLDIKAPVTQRYIYHWLSICSYRGVKEAVKWAHQNDKKDKVYKPLAYTDSIVNNIVEKLKSEHKNPKQNQSVFGILSRLKNKVFFAMHRNASDD